MLLAFLSPKFLFSVFSRRNGGKALVSMFCQLSVFTSLEIQWCPRVILFSNHSLQIANLGKGLSGIVVNLCHSKMLLMQFYGCILYKEAFVKYSFTSVFIHFSLGRWWDLDVFKCCPLIKTSFSFFVITFSARQLMNLGFLQEKSNPGGYGSLTALSGIMTNCKY